ncbi:hypothetical protein [Bradyrhizobium sp. CCBAU 21359]|uniref:hypothetical protein n=1 Tax=Bradyrhizobium sp. CCBAU 21359 TaxID=1325080 RepID=UPI00230640B1|nr:hypothetical protein [Bradyrhizobium sp. CCBAU 21359]
MRLYARRPPGDIARRLHRRTAAALPVVQARVDSAGTGLAAIGELADEFDASLLSTGSRFTTFSRELCALVVSEGGKIRYSARSARAPPSG